MAELIVDYNDGDTDVGTNVYRSGGGTYFIWAQVFLTPSAFNVGSIRVFALRSSGASAGTITAYITAVDGNDKPTGASLGSGSVDLMSITATDIANPENGEWVTFTMSSTVSLNNGTKYAIVLACSGVNPINSIFWVRDANGSYSDGKAYSNDSASPPVGDLTWTAHNSGLDDFLFEVYNDFDPPASGPDITTKKRLVVAANNKIWYEDI
ncbi:MAG TPA: hypothetical protein ENI05_02185 [Porticoccus sp.]|nr:hypothetical protein [Porticoccus sp.]